MSILHESERNPPTIVAYCDKCNKIVGAAVNDDGCRKQAANAASSWIEAGLRVTTLPVAEVRAAEWCECRIEAPMRDDPKYCQHPHLNEDGICRACGADKRGIGE